MRLSYELRKRWTLVIVVALLVAACGGGTTETTETPADAGTTEAASGDDDTVDEGEPSTEDPIKVGGTLGLTGAFAGPSAGYKAAYDLWLENINAAGGILGRPVEMVIFDDESDPSVAQSLYQRLVSEEEVDLLLAPFSTAVGGAVIPIAEQNQMVLWNGGFVGVELFLQSDWIVGAYTYQEPDYSRGVFEMIDSLPDDQKPGVIGIATAQNPFTLAVRDGFDGEGGVLNFAAERGIEVAVNEEYAMGVSDVQGIIQQAKSAGVDAFFALATPNDAQLLATTAAELDFEPSIICYCGSQVTSLPFWGGLGEAGDLAFSTAMAWPSDGYGIIEELEAVFQDELEFPELPAYGTVAYGILEVMTQAVEAVGGLDQEALRDYVTNNSFDTTNGPIAFDENRIPAYNAIVMQFQNGKNEVVWPPERATADPSLGTP